MADEPTIVGLCGKPGCTGQITHAFVRTMTLSDGQIVNLYETRCTVGGTACLYTPWPLVGKLRTTTDAPAFPTTCGMCEKPITAREEWTTPLGHPAHVACVSDPRNALWHLQVPGTPILPGESEPVCHTTWRGIQKVTTKPGQVTCPACRAFLSSNALP